MRISKTQNIILRTLALLESRGRFEHVESVKLYKIISSEIKVADTNFRTSCHKLVHHRLLHKLRDPHSAMLAFELTSKGREKANELLEKE